MAATNASLQAKVESGDFRVELRAMEATADTLFVPSRNFSHSERLEIVQALELCGGNRQETAKVLAMGRSTLYRKLKKFGL